MKLKIVLAALMAFVITAASSQEYEEWKLKKEKDGIKAFIRKRPGIKFNEYLVETTIEANLNQIYALFKDYESYSDIFPGTTDIKVYLDKPDHHITYIKFKIPFPARDRDAVFLNHLTYDRDKRMLGIDVQCDPDQYETNKKLIRITFCEGYWEFHDLENGQIKIRHQLIVDPAGRAPAFIVNAKTVDDPIKTLQNIKKFISLEKYRNKVLPFLSHDEVENGK